MSENKSIVSLRGCPICGGQECDVLHNQNFTLPDGHPLSDGYKVVVCRKCGFVYADSQVSQQDYDRFYAKHSKYEDAKTSTGGGGSPEDTLRLKDMAARLAEAIPNRQARILDIGCAAGGLLKELELLGYTHLFGLDPSPSCVSSTKAICNADAFVGSLAEFPEEIGSFDCVVLSHVLEHVSNLSQAVQSLTKLVSTNGMVYVEVPDATRYAECLLAPFQDFNTEHINHFSSQSLRNLFTLQGWDHEGGNSKTLSLGAGMTYPAVFQLFSNQSSLSAVPSYQFDSQLRTSIEDYIRVSRTLMQRIDERIAAVLSIHEQVIVWGTGQLAMKLLNETCLGKAKIAAFVDGNPINQGKMLNNIPILSPADLQDSRLKTQDTPIIITSIIQAKPIAEAIALINLPNPVVHLVD